MILEGRVWKFDRDIAATDLLPGRYDKLGMRREWDLCAQHLLEDVDSSVAGRLRKGDLLMVGGTLGLGHCHYYGPSIMACRSAGIGGILARDINEMFFRAATDLGLPTWRYPELVDQLATGEELTVDLAEGSAREAAGKHYALAPVPALILDIFNAGSSTNWALGRAGIAV